MGGRGSFGNSAQTKINDALEKIRNRKKETLLVFDTKGNIVYSEIGKSGHVGYSESDYVGKIVAHNHPQGYAPYPSKTDFETFERSGAREMIIASQNYTVSLKADPQYKSLSGVREPISTAAHYMGEQKIFSQTRQSLRQGKITKNEANERILSFYKKVAKRAGYIFSYSRRSK